MLRDPNGPLKIPPAYLPTITPWLWRFWRSSYGAAYEHGVAALIELNTRRRRGHRGAVRARRYRRTCSSATRRSISTRASSSYQRVGRPHWQTRDRRRASSPPHVNAAEIRDLEPNLAPIFPHGVISHEWAIVTDPYRGGHRAVRSRRRRRGVIYERAQGDRRIGATAVGRRRHAARRSTRCWSPPASGRSRWRTSLGETLPVEAERGYNLTYPGPARRA